MAKFTLDQITEALEAVVRARGEDYMYQQDFSNGSSSCKYIARSISRGRVIPACIVGATMSYLGVSDSTLRRWDNTPTGSSVIDIETTLIPEDAKLALQKAQEVQDRGNTWGNALQAYKTRVAQGYAPSV